MTRSDKINTAKSDSPQPADLAFTIPPSERDRLQLALRQIIQFYEAWENPAEAEKWRAKLEESKP